MIVLGLGSSGPTALRWLRRAVTALKQETRLLRIVSVSAIYESDAMLPEGAPASWDVDYLNLAVRVDLLAPQTTPPELLVFVKELETKLGRKPRERWAPREIDIDILAWDDLRLDTETLTLPHPGLLERPFALLPLADVAPEWIDHDPRASAQLLRWQALAPSVVPYRTRKSLARLTELMAVLSLTPDSFSDGGELFDEETIATRAYQAIEKGATILDLGAESTRPGAYPITPEEEWRRLWPALEATREWKARGLIQISIDSRHSETIRRALEDQSLDWINDVTGFESTAMRELARESQAQLVFMHSLGIPPSRAVTLPLDHDPVRELHAWARIRMEELERFGIAPTRMIFDPGIGFGKTPTQNLRILQHSERFHELGIRILIGHSRKSFLTLVDQPGTSIPARERDLETALLTAQLADRGIEYLRVHDPASQMRALRLSAAWDGTSRWRRLEPK